MVWPRNSGWLARRTATAAAAHGLPAAPTGLMARAISSSSAILRWVDASGNETGFLVERKTGVGGTYQQIASLGANATTCTDTGLTTGESYIYRVRATFSGVGDSAWSNEATAIPFVDADNDGIPDDWETAHGLNPAVNDASGDADGDGVSNLNEYLLGRDPQRYEAPDANDDVQLRLFLLLEDL